MIKRLALLVLGGIGMIGTMSGMELSKVTIRLMNDQERTVTEVEWLTLKKLIMISDIVQIGDNDINFGQLSGADFDVIMKHLAALSEGGQVLQDLLESFLFTVGNSTAAELDEGWTLLIVADYISNESLSEALAQYVDNNLVRILKKGGSLVDSLINLPCHMFPLRQALLLAAGMGEKDVVELLLRYRAPIEAADEKGKTALCWACQKGHKKVVELLLARGAHLPNSDAIGTPLFYAWEFGKKDVEALLRARILEQQRWRLPGWCTIL